MNVIGFKTYLAPNGNDKVKISQFGYIEFINEPTAEVKKAIREFCAFSLTMLEKESNKKPTPFKVFELMGWKELK